ncbi:DUF1365 family protein [bacterium]|nr:DUF1365 family protein [bacterium]
MRELRSHYLRGEVFHLRTTPVTHRFSYPVRYFAVDLEELSKLGSHLWGFRSNAFSLYSLHDRDYLGAAPERETSLADKVRYRVEEHLPGTEVAQILLVTVPRFLGYIFNPVSFFYCYDAAGAFVAFLADVNNTFGDGHLYVAAPQEVAQNQHEEKGFRYTERQKKRFHVSPFFDRSGDYEFQFNDIRESFAVRISIRRGNGRDFLGEVRGNSSPFHELSGIETHLVFPLTGVLTYPRILWQAARLHFQRRLPVYARPIPDHIDTHTIRRSTLFEAWCRTLVFRALRQIQGGAIRFCFPDGTSSVIGDAGDYEQPITVQIRHHRFFSRLLLGSDIGAGESYVAGDWESDDLPGLLTLLSRNKERLNLRQRWCSPLLRQVDNWIHRRRRNSREGSRSNIAAHYDLSNKMFSLFLDPSMTYSCGIFESEATPLDEAQEKKLDEMLRLGEVQRGETILEIGCGWGSFALKAAQELGCHVTCLTLSEEQAAFARERVERAGLEELIEIRLQDYRDVQGEFDRIISIEMIEAVGEEYLEEYFQACERLLKPGGKVVIQAITLDHRRMELYRRGCDWIQKHIFPGCFVPSYEVLQQKVRSATQLRWSKDQAIGPHYATTLSLWAKRFVARKSELMNLGFSADFLRKWMYYFGYCEAGFASGELNTYQFVLQKE